MLSVVGSILILMLLTVALIVTLTFAVYQSSRKRIGYIPLPGRAVPDVIKALGLEGAGTLIDLGCGDGRILEAAAKTNPRVKGLGVEINPIVFLLARWRLRNQSKSKVVQGDIATTPLSSARWVFTYLSNRQMAGLEPKFETELPKGCRLVSCDFPLPKRKPNHTVKIGEKRQLGQNLYIYDF